jgi:hypothetical protein
MTINGALVTKGDLRIGIGSNAGGARSFEVSACILTQKRRVKTPYNLFVMYRTLV